MYCFAKNGASVSFFACSVSISLTAYKSILDVCFTIKLLLLYMTIAKRSVYITNYYK